MLFSAFKRAFIGTVDIPAARRAEINAARRRRFLRLAPLAAAHGLVAALVLTVTYWNEPAMPLVFAWCYANAVLLMIRVREARRAARKIDDGEAQDRRIVAHTLLSGAVWGGIVAALMTTGAPSHQLLLGVLTGSILCVGALMHSTFTAASLGYSLFVGVGAVVGMIFGGYPFVAETAVVLFAGIFALQRFTVSNSANIIHRRLNAAALEDAKETVSLLLTDFEEHSSDWLWRTDDNGRIARVSERFAEVAGAPREELEGASFMALFAPESVEELASVMRNRVEFRNLSLRVNVNGREGWWSLSGQPASDGGYRGVATDITRAREAESRIAYVTYFDTLTDLPNRAMLVRQLDVAVETAGAEIGSFALFCIDLDNFKAVNDTLGHAEGDLFLKVIADRLRDCVPGDAFLARLGGDEFAILQKGVTRTEAALLADLIVDALLAPVMAGGREILTGGSVGIAMSPDDGVQPAELLKNAELALYRAKAQGRGCYRFFETGMDEDARWRANLEADLRGALSAETMDVYFQPLVDTRTHQTTGYETLLRWNRAGHGLISPAVFISCAEETGVIVPLGEWVIRKAIAEAAQWRDDLAVAINLSPAQMQNPALVSTIVGALAVSGLDPRRLEIEITESVLMHETEQNLRTLHALRELGVKVALDDFGTGYSSLSYLRAFPFDKIKIDQRFVRDIETSLENQAIVRAVISLARDLGMRITAEGVENEQQAAILAGMGCTEVQGFLYSRPAPASEIPKKEDGVRPSAKVLPMRRRLA